MKKVSVKDIISCLGEQILKVAGAHEGVYIDNLADVSHTSLTTLDWVNPSKSNKQEIVEKSPARVILVDMNVEYVEGKVLIYVKNPKRALATVGNAFFVRRPEPGIHPTAIISKDACIGKNVYIGPYSVVGKAQIGDNCIIDSHVRIHDGVVMGCNCNVKSGAVLGGEGFGFEKDEQGNRFRFPQIGGLLIGDYVEIGGNTCIDRGALSDTKIGNYTKISNLCQIAHNVQLGQNVIVTGCVEISGSVTVGENTWIGPNACVRDQRCIGRNSKVGMGSVVVKNIPDNEVWAGCPAKYLRES